MSVHTLKEKSRRELTSPITAEAYLIRKLSFHEVMQANVDAILGANEKPPTASAASKPEGIFAIALANKMEIAAQRHILEQGVITPRIDYGPEESTPDGALNIRWVGADAPWLAGEILKFSGMDPESAQKVQALIKNGASPVSSTPSADVTGDSPMRS